MKCSKCDAQTKATRHGNGWKKFQGDSFCAQCWSKRFILRAVTIPIASPQGMDWKAFRLVLAEQWALTTQCSNWMMRECYLRDIRRNGQKKMPPMPSVYLYPEACRLFPDLDRSALTSLEQATKGRYRAMRYDIVWTCRASLPTFRYPTPMPVKGNTWSAYFDDGNRPCISARVGRNRLHWRLKGGARYRRQLAQVRQFADGSAKQGEMAVYQAHDGTIMCKMVGWFKKPKTPRGLSGECWVFTGPGGLLTAVDSERERLWIYHANHLQRWTAEQAYRMECWRDDSKAEMRPDPPFSERRRAAGIKFRRRTSSLIHEASRALANFAARRRFETVYYDDTNHEFCQSFRWFELLEKIVCKFDEAGITLIHTGGTDGKEETDPNEGS